MTWARFDDQFWSHPKVLKVGNEATGVFVRLVCYACAHLTDGFVPESTARLVAGRRWERLLGSLVEATMLEPAQNGYTIHGFLERNPSASEVNSQREKTRAKVANWREKQGNAKPVTGLHDGYKPVSNQDVTPPPSRPVPSPSPSPCLPEGELLPLPPTVEGGAGGTSPPGAERPAAPSKGKTPRERPAPAADPVPAAGSPARAVYDAILADPVLAPITRGPGDWSQRATSGAYPGVDVEAEVRRLGEYAARYPGKYTDGRAYLSRNLQAKADRIAAQPKAQQPLQRSLREMDYSAHADDFELEAELLGRRAS